MRRPRLLLVLFNLHTGFVRLFPFAYGALVSWLRQEGLDPVVRVVELNRSWHPRRLLPAIRAFEPDLVGITGPSSNAVAMGRAVARIRAVFPDLPVVAGGAHAMLVPGRVVAETGATLAVTGEGERPLAAVVRRLADGERDLSGIPGTWLRGRERPEPRERFLEDLDALEPPARDIVDFQAITDANMGNVFMLAGRGCPWRCSFCSNHVYAGRGEGRWARMRSPEHVFAEIAALERRYRFRGLVFRDDTFTWDRRWALSFCEGYPRRFRYPFCIFARADTLDEELVGALARAGCSAVWVGIDAGSPDIRNRVLRKSATDEQLLAAADALHRHGVALIATNMVGLPYETPEDHRRTVELNRRLYAGARSFTGQGGIGPKCFVFGPFPGTDLDRLCREEGWVRDRPAAVYRESFLEMPGFPPREVERAARRFRWEVHKRNHLGLALAWRFRDSRVGEAVYRVLPGGALVALSRRFQAASERAAGGR